MEARASRLIAIIAHVHAESTVGYQATGGRFRSSAGTVAMRKASYTAKKRSTSQAATSAKTPTVVLNEGLPAIAETAREDNKPFNADVMRPSCQCHDRKTSRFRTTRNGRTRAP